MIEDNLKIVEKVVIYILRKRGDSEEVLVFDQIKYPHVNPQVPSGTVDAGEDLKQAAFRELFEESGLKLKSEFKCIGHYVFYKNFNRQFQERNFFVTHLSEELPEEWIHIVSGEGVDKNLEFKYYWMPIEEAQKKLTVNLGDGFIYYFRK